MTDYKTFFARKVFLVRSDFSDEQYTSANCIATEVITISGYLTGEGGSFVQNLAVILEFTSCSDNGSFTDKHTELPLY